MRTQVFKIDDDKDVEVSYNLQVNDDATVIGALTAGSLDVNSRITAEDYVEVKRTGSLARPGFLILEAVNTKYYLWADSNGKLRIHDSPPTYDEEDEDGSIVGP